MSAMVRAMGAGLSGLKGTALGAIVVQPPCDAERTFPPLAKVLLVKFSGRARVPIPQFFFLWDGHASPSELFLQSCIVVDAGCDHTASRQRPQISPI